VCADIEDLRGMATNEGMAIRFHKRGDAADLAEHLIAILQSPELQRQMAEHNFTAGVEMTMTSVVKNYLRWFELHKCKRAIRNAGVLPGARRLLRRALRFGDPVPDWNMHKVLTARQKEALGDRHGAAPAESQAHADETGPTSA
jgi:hypothetical protein